MFQAALLLLAVIYSRLYWVLKAGLILLSLGFSTAFYHATVDALGYPVATIPSGQYEFLGGMVHEPYPARGDPGVIYVWLVETGQKLPRAIALPYSIDLRKQTAQAKRMVLGGQRVFFRFGQQPTASADAKGGDGRGGSSRLTGHTGSHVPYNVQEVPTLEFQPPPDTVPRKDD